MPRQRASFPDDKIRLVVATQLQAVRHASIVFDVNDSHIDLGFFGREERVRGGKLEPRGHKRSEVWLCS
jgi:hypothetical protein